MSNLYDLMTKRLLKFKADKLKNWYFLYVYVCFKQAKGEYTWLIYLTDAGDDSGTDDGGNQAKTTLQRKNIDAYAAQNHILQKVQVSN